MVTTRSEVYTFDLSGGRLCLDLANTVSDRGSDHPVDHLRTYGDVIAWAQQAGAVKPGVARTLLDQAAARPEAARHALATAVDAREMLYRLLAAVIKSAIELLTSPDLDRLRICAADTCAWLFLDTTKNRTRRWCDMKVCGNREKMRRFRARH